MNLSIQWNMTDWQGCEKRQICPVINRTRSGGHFDFDLSWATEVRSVCRPHFKINLMVSPNNGRTFMFSSKVHSFLLNRWTNAKLLTDRTMTTVSYVTDRSVHRRNFFQAIAAKQKWIKTSSLENFFLHVL